MVYTLAVANRKGGVAKTTTAANVADLAASRGLRVLLVDLDPQGNATTLTAAVPLTTPDPTGFPVPLTVADALYHAKVRATAAPQAGTLLGVIVRAGEHWAPTLYVAPANEDLAARGVESFGGNEQRLDIALAGAEQHYDLVVLDCPPSLGPLFVNALYAADGVLLVTEAADNALEGLPGAVETIYSVQGRRPQVERRRPVPELLGVVVSSMPAREMRAGELLNEIREEYGELLWGIVPRRSVVRQAEGARAPLRAYGAQGRDVVEAYNRITTRLLYCAGLSPMEVL
jgi:chromosome partitioning protein